MEVTAIAYVKEPLALFEYREVVSINNGIAYLENVNILFANKIIEKIKFESGTKPYKKGLGKKIATNYLKEMVENNKKKKKNSNKKRVVKTAYEKAANNLFEEFGI